MAAVLRSLEKKHLAELGVGAAWLVGVAAAVRVVELLVGRSPLVAAVLAAVVVDLAVGRAGVRWDEGGAAARPWPRALLRGAGAALAVVAVVLLASAATGLAHVTHGHPSLAVGLALARAAGIAVRDELLYRGLVLVVATRANVPDRVALPFAALAGAAPVVLLPGTSPAAVALVLASGLAFAVLWRRSSGAWAPVAAHAAWVLLSGALLRGSLLDVTWSHGQLTEGARASGAPALLAAVAWLAIAAVLWKRLEPAPPKSADARNASRARVEEEARRRES